MWPVNLWYQDVAHNVRIFIFRVNQQVTTQRAVKLPWGPKLIPLHDEDGQDDHPEWALPVTLCGLHSHTFYFFKFRFPIDRLSCKLFKGGLYWYLFKLCNGISKTFFVLWYFSPVCYHYRRNAPPFCPIGSLSSSFRHKKGCFTSKDELVLYPVSSKTFRHFLSALHGFFSSFVLNLLTFASMVR